MCMALQVMRIHNLQSSSHIGFSESVLTNSVGSNMNHKRVWLMMNIYDTMESMIIFWQRLSQQTMPKMTYETCHACKDELMQENTIS